MSTTVNLVVPCADRKTLKVPESLLLRSTRAAGEDARYREWKRRVSSHQGERRRADQLYAGDQWAFLRRLMAGELPVAFDVSLWVMSAGVGLVAADEILAPYAATFAPGHADSVPRATARQQATRNSQAWWERLTEDPILQGGRPRSLTELARSSPRSPLLVAGSPPYIGAIALDLERAREALSSADLLTLVSSRSEIDAVLSTHLVTATAKAQPLVGGSLQSLNVRLSVRCLELAGGHKSGLRADRLRTGIEEWLGASTSPGKRPTRSPSSDAEVRIWIREQLRGDPRAKHSGLLRQYRESNRACEQSRFARIYRQVVEQSNG